MDSEQLALAFQRGDSDAFAEVYHLYNEEVRERIRRSTLHSLQSELDDICQHFWMEIHRWGHSYDPTLPLKNWLIATAGKAPASYYKANTRKSHVKLILMGQHLGDKDGRDDREGSNVNPMDKRPGPEACAIFQEDLTAIKEALEQIPPQFQKVINAVYLQGLNPLVYARIAGIPRGTVYTQLQRGVEHLRKALCLQA